MGQSTNLQLIESVLTTNSLLQKQLPKQNHEWALGCNYILQQSEHFTNKDLVYSTVCQLSLQLVSVSVGQNFVSYAAQIEL